MGSRSFVELFMAKALHEDLGTIFCFHVIANPHVIFVMLSLYYAQCPSYLLHIMFPSLGILQQYVEFNTCTIITLEKLIWCGIFWWFYWSLSSLLGHSSCFLGGVWLSFYSSNCCLYIPGMLGFAHSYTYHSFPIRWSPYSSKCNNTCWDWHFYVPNNTTRCQSPFPLGCLLSCPTFWKLSGLILPLVVVFGESPTWARVYFSFNKHSFKYHANTFPFMCMSKGRRFIINLFYHICISFIPSLLLYNTMYLSWLATSYSCPSFTMLMWSYHWWSKYPFTLVLLWKLTYNNPWYTLDTIAFIILESGAHVQREVSHLFLHHNYLMTSGYLYH